jgi:hypothetical protein
VADATAVRLEKPLPPYLFSVRGTSGLGGGEAGLGARFGLAAELWEGDWWGLGLEGAGLAQGELFGSSDSALLLAPMVALRSRPRGGYFVGALGVGLARVVHTESAGLCIDFEGRGCPRDQVRRYGAYALQAAFGWLGHPFGSSFELGPVMRLDATSGFHGEPGNVLMTLNLELGVALFGR